MRPPQDDTLSPVRHNIRSHPDAEQREGEGSSERKPHSVRCRTSLIRIRIIFKFANIKINYLSLALVTYYVTMIISFASTETDKIWNGYRSGKLPGTIQDVARRKLRMINNAQDIADLRIPPANRLEKLSGRYKEYYSIRIDDQWRIIFKWRAGNASNVEIIDYH